MNALSLLRQSVHESRGFYGLDKKPIINPMQNTLNVLFVCVENSNRSQMAQAFAQLIGGTTVTAYSAGSKPSGIVNPKAISAMQELDYDLSKHESTSIDELPNIKFDFVATMGCGDSCSSISTHALEDWNIPDPRDMNAEEFRRVRDLIQAKVKDSVTRLRITKKAAP